MSNIKSINPKIILSLISLFGGAVSFVLRDKPYGIVKQRKENNVQWTARLVGLGLYNF